ncbi:MAG: GyrI-like domain-containing protein [Cyclobacteriaceae bacterium]
MKMVAEKLDLFKVDANYYKVGKSPEIRNLETYNYLTIHGQSAPENPMLWVAVETLYQVGFGIKFISKSEDEDFVMPKMEGFWWISGGAKAQAEFANTPKEDWFWKFVIRMPGFIRQDHFDRAVETIKFKKNPSNLGKLNFEQINEGKCAQVLHIGSYDAEAPTIEKLHEFIKSEGYEIAGYHHEIYLSDPRRTAENKLRTIIRYAVQ